MDSKMNAAKKIRERICELEQEYDIEISNTEKLLLSADGPIVTMLDVLYGDVKLFFLAQRIEKAEKDIAEKLDINEGDEIDFREVILHKNGRPLVYAKSYIPKERCSDEVIDKLLDEEKTTGKIFVEREIETIRRIKDISIVEPTPIITDLFKTTDNMLSREYVMVHKKEVVIWTKEVYPIHKFV